MKVSIKMCSSDKQIVKFNKKRPYVNTKLAFMLAVWHGAACLKELLVDFYYAVLA